MRWEVKVLLGNLLLTAERTNLSRGKQEGGDDPLLRYSRLWE
ncbi:hypothetical protein EV701_13260 [Chthoniobacter flavus]|nr:hypothetical protein EV701_13260 [Chthoniobacter flavus]